MSEEYPESFFELMRDVAEAHPDDIEAGVDAAYRRWVCSPHYATCTKRMVREAIRRRIHDYRHTVNVEIRREAGFYGGPAKVTGAGSAVEKVARNVLNEYSICGVMLGKISGAHLLHFAEQEEARAEGHLFNVRLCRRLAAVVPADKTVAQSVPLSRVRQIFKECARVKSKLQRN